MKNNLEKLRNLARAEKVRLQEKRYKLAEKHYSLECQMDKLSKEIEKAQAKERALYTD